MIDDNETNPSLCALQLRFLGYSVAYIVKPLTRFSFEPAPNKLRRLFEEFR
ncbi:MAG TPA: hypothetical protein VN754_07420 [Candidatus Binataceae bacterium]|nr:hypothetical protein [Candidatus Binataceae bacterium]